MSDFHPETWNPMVRGQPYRTLYPSQISHCMSIACQWSVGTILMGLYSFMLEESPTYGSIVTSEPFKRKAAKESLEFNVKNKYALLDLFCSLISHSSYWSAVSFFWQDIL